ncbi:MAG TPA: type II secretion system F family protein [Arachnia sp.]|nr:type II secretion system F family protein [Arachnia sp.]HMT85244.1 type II secretion system F family protein [Arachnia sp.]
MGTVIAATSGALLVLGALLLFDGLRRRERFSTESSTGLWKKASSLWERLSPKRRRWVLVALAAGFLTAAVTGWVLALVVVPVALITIPLLLSEPAHHEVELLAALDRWVRLLATSLTSGKSIRDAVFATRGQTPAPLVAAVTRLCDRLDQRWPTRDALLAMADELDSADADAVLAALAIASSRGGIGTHATLTGLSDTIQDRLRALREVSAERAKPRVVVRQVTIITLAVLGLALVFSGSFFAPYRTPLGQLFALLLCAAYLGCLVMLRRRTVPPPAPRFLRSRS